MVCLMPEASLPISAITERAFRAMFPSRCLILHRELTHNVSQAGKIEPDPGERLVKPNLVNLGRVRDAHDLGDQVVAGTEGKIVMQIFVAVDVDLCRQRNVKALEKYLDGARIAGVPEGD